MSLITRCPACGTMFKVVPDQLRISEGWVRCGHCTEIFDGSAHLQDAHTAAEAVSQVQAPPPAEALPEVHREPQVELRPEPKRESEWATDSVRADAMDSQDFESSISTRTGEEPLDSLPDSALLEEEARALREDPLDKPFEFRPASAPVPLEPEPELDDLAFVQQAQRKAFWSRTGVRFVLALFVLLLAALLAGQVAIHDRDRLAAAQPQWRPWIARLCEPLRCRIELPRALDALVIESSSFNKLRGDAYRLNFTLKNQAPTEVAMPALELTLTDGQDQPVLRRVLMPAELGVAAAGIAAAGEVSSSLALAVTPSALEGARVAGYRLLAFYP